MLKKGFLLGLLLAVSFTGFAQYNYNADSQKAYALILDLRFDAAQKQINQIKKEQPTNLVPFLLENYIDFLSVTLLEDKARFDEIRDRKKERISQWKIGDKKSPYYRLGIAQMNMQWAFARVTIGEYFSAALEINQAYHLLEENKIEYPDFLPNALGLGVLHAMIGVVPEQYQWAVNLLGLYGSIDQGLNELELLLNSNRSDFEHFKPEALFLYTFLKLNLQNDADRIQHVLRYYQTSQMDSLVKQSPLMHFAKGVALMRQNNDSALLLLENRPYAPDALSFYYAQFMLGQAKLYDLQPSALLLFDTYVKEYPGNNFKQSAMQKKAWSAFVQGDTLGYKKSMQSLLQMPNTRIDADEAAVKEAKQVEEGYIPNVYLLKSRILFDGGYLQKALMVLQNADTASFTNNQRIELKYRKGRIYDQMGIADSALAYYGQTIQHGEKFASYFAANSSLKMGEIYERQKKYKQAKDYYQKCLELDFDEYRRSIRAKAKAGLQRVNAN